MNATKKTSKMRLLSLLLVLCMVATLLPVMPMTAFAATNDAIQEGTAVLGTGANSATAATVYFGKDGSNNPIAWRVIGYNGTGVASGSGNITLIAKGNLAQSQFAQIAKGSAYEVSTLKQKVDEIDGNLSDGEKNVVIQRTLDNIEGPEVTNAVLWPLSTDEAKSMDSGLRQADPANPTSTSSRWWLRSGGDDGYRAAFVNGDGDVNPYGNYVDIVYGVRPAFHLNLSSVLFTSAAVGGKSNGTIGADALKLVEDNAAGTEWKLTLKDSTRSTFTASLNASSSNKVAAGGNVSVDYSGAKTGSNEYISAMIVDNSGNVLYYGNIANNSASGTNQAITIPAGLAAGSYTLKIFNEQLNGDKKTDYASEFNNIEITVTAGGGTTTIYVWVDGTQVTSDNKDDILNNGGKASYDPGSRTLTLNGYKGGAIRADHALTVTLAEGSKNIVTNPADNEEYCISANNNDLTINGSGNLEVIQNRYNCSAISTSAITTYTGGKLIIDMEGDLDVRTYNWHGFYAYESVTISGSGDVSICIEGKWDGNKGTGIVSETEDVILSGSGKLNVDATNAWYAVRLKAPGKALLLKGTGAPLRFSAGMYAIVNQADNSSPVGGDNFDYYNKVTGAPKTASVVYDHKAEPLTMKIPISKTVVQGGNVAPGTKTFEFEVKPYGNSQADLSGLTITGTTIETNGANTYTGTIKIVGPEDVINNARGFAITEKNDGAENWDYDTATYIVYPDSDNSVLIQKDMGPNKSPAPTQTAEFTNTYTKKEAPAQTTYTLTTSVTGGHGTISAGKTGLAENTKETVIFTPDEGYEIDKVTVNGVETGVLSNVLDVTMDGDKTVVVTYKQTQGGNTSGSGQTTSPQTGDNSNMLLWIALLLTSCGGVITTFVVKRKRVRSK